MPRKSQKKLADVGNNVPANFKFALIAGVVIFWTEFLKNVISVFIATYADAQSPLLVSLITAIIFTIIVYLILNFYTNIRNKLKDIEIDFDNE